MLRIAGREVHQVRGENLQVSINSASDARMVRAEMPNCHFTVHCGCGKFHIEGQDGVKLFHLAEKHFHETGHKAIGHFMFGEGRVLGEGK